MPDWDIGKPGSGGGGDGFKNAAHEKHLLAFIGCVSMPQVKTPYGVDDAVKCDWIICLTDGMVKRDAMVFGTALVPALLEGTSLIITARLEKGASAKPGQNPPWILSDSSAEDDAMVTAWLDAHAVKMPSGAILVEAGEQAAHGSF